MVADNRESFETASRVVGRTSPHSLEAEEYLLSCCFLDGQESLPGCLAAHISPASFYDPKHGILFEILLDLFARQLPTEIHNVAEELKVRRQLDQVGGYAFLTQVTSRIPTTAQLSYFIDKVAEQYRLRRIIMLATALVEECYGFSGDMHFAEKRISQLGEVLTNQTSNRSWGQAVDEAELQTRERMKPAEERKSGGTEISWGIPDFDRYFQPVETGELVIVGGYTSSGKSSLLRQVLWSIARAGHPALIETIEVRDAEEAVNLAGHISGLRSRARLDELHPKDQSQLLDAFTTMRAPNFAVSDQDHDLASILARARAFKRKHGLKAFGTDYLQIMRDVSEAKSVDRTFAIGRVTGALKRFATLENTAAFLLSGFNREYIRDGHREPRLSDLEGSGSIEKDASRVILLDVPTEYVVRGTRYTQSLTADAEDQPTFFVKAIQAKGRNQGTASVGLIFRRETKTFTQMQR